MNMERMQEILDDCLLVEKTPEYHFDIRSWIRSAVVQVRDNLFLYSSLSFEEMISPHCGTTACVIGWHMRLHPHSLLRSSLERQPMFISNGTCYHGFDAVSVYLEIDREQAVDLFGPSVTTVTTVTTIRAVIQKIESAMETERQKYIDYVWA